MNKTTSFILIVFVLAGCATERHVEEEYERESRIAEVRDEILWLKSDCEAAGRLFRYVGPMSGNKVQHANARRKGTIYISRHAHPGEYRCE